MHPYILQLHFAHLGIMPYGCGNLLLLCALQHYYYFIHARASYATILKRYPFRRRSAYYRHVAKSPTECAAAVHLGWRYFSYAYRGRNMPFSLLGAVRRFSFGINSGTSHWLCAARAGECFFITASNKRAPKAARAQLAEFAHLPLFPSFVGIILGKRMAKSMVNDFPVPWIEYHSSCFSLIV